MMIESLKEEMKKSLEEIQEKPKINQASKQTKTNRKKIPQLQPGKHNQLKEIHKFIKDGQGKANN